NSTDGQYSFIGGGLSHLISSGGIYSAIIGGKDNTIDGGYGTITGGQDNYLFVGLYSTIGGGKSDTVTSDYGFVGGGFSNKVDADYSSIVGGSDNYVNSTTASGVFIGGGSSNTASATNAVIAGGNANTVSGTSANVNGGDHNIASGNYSDVGGGGYNMATADYTAITGGYALRLGGIGSFGFNGYNTNADSAYVSTNRTAYFGNVDLWLGNTDNTTSELRFYEAQSTDGTFPAAGTNYTAFKAGTQTADLTYTLPSAYPTVSGQVLSSTTGGVMSWVTASGGLTNFTESVHTSAPNTTVPVVRLLATNVATNVDVALSPKGTGALTADVADNLSGGGNKRGLSSVDWQMSRNASTQVAGGSYAVISGGSYNSAGGDYSNVTGGFSNSASANYSTVSGGYVNTASGLYSTISGGWTNTVTGYASAVTGGYQNSVSGDRSVASGGNNTVSGNYAAVSGGFSNTVTAIYATIGGGFTNTSNGNSSTVGGGSTNSALGSSSTVAGGNRNYVADDYASIGGGLEDTISTSATYATISGGQRNKITATLASISGGYQHLISGSYSSIGGGFRDTITSSYSTISGGYDNNISSQYSTIIGGRNNIVSADYSTVLGGQNNSATNLFNLVYGNGVVPDSAHTYRVYFFDSTLAGKLAMNREFVPYTDVITIGKAGGNMGNGARLTTGGTWTNSSSRTFKDRFTSLDSSDILHKVRDMELKGWWYKNTEEYHIGPFAEDFRDAFGTGELNDTTSRKHVAALDVAGVALYSSQQLIKQNEQLYSENERMKSENESIKLRLERLESIISNKPVSTETVTPVQQTKTNAPRIVSIAPDPAGNYAVVKFELPKAANVELFVSAGNGTRTLDIMSGVFMQAGTYDVEVNLNDVANGWYVCELRASTESAQRLFRVVK
ncbi:MAG: hypothetical protein JNJ85_09640, partial [Candidatus Kapabacteria bacterium]|nr:hypothetical protein [Candidatus Kapabacteria bacterium]